MRILFALCLLAGSGLAQAAEPCESGLKPGQRPGPYSSVVSTGSNRGQSHCFICETGDRPAIILFAKTPDDSLAKLAAAIDKALVTHKDAELRSWITFLSADQSSFDPKVVDWSRKAGLKGLASGVFEDVQGPPSYKLGKDADLTILLSVKQKVVRNFAFRSGELDAKKIDEIVAAIKDILPKK